MSFRRKKSASRSKLNRLLAVLLVAPLAAAATLEIGTRIFIRQEALVYQDSRDPRLGFELKPGAEGYKSGSWVRIDSLGLRQPEMQATKSSNEFRVLVVGDHPSFALGLPEEAGYVQQLRQFFRLPPDVPFSVANLSMYNYNLEQKMESFKRRGALFDADAVILQLGPRDLERKPKPWLNRPGLKNFLREHSRFYRWMTERIFARRSPPSSGGESLPPDAPKKILALLSDFKKACGKPAMIAYFPDLSKGETARAPAAIEPGLMHDAAKLGIPFINVSRAFDRHAPSALLLDPSKPYLNALGQSLAAKAIAPHAVALAKHRLARLRPPRRRYPKLVPPERVP